MLDMVRAAPIEDIQNAIQPLRGAYAGVERPQGLTSCVALSAGWWRIGSL
jgi:hypothetical protein